MASLDAVKADTLRAVVNERTRGLAGARNSLTLAPWGTGALEPFRARLAGYVVNKATFQVPVDWNVDADLLRDMVATRLSELDG